NNNVITSTPVEQITPVSARQNIVPVLAIKLIVTRATSDHVVASSRHDNIILIRTEKRFALGRTGEPDPALTNAVCIFAELCNHCSTDIKDGPVANETQILKHRIQIKRCTA